jgi:hypothetical protein
VGLIAAVRCEMIAHLTLLIRDSRGQFMSAQLILDNDFASLWLHPDTKIVHHQFKKYIHGTQFREVLNSGYDLLVKHRCTKWLSDDSNNGAVTPEDEKWSQNEWFPRVLKAGWKHWAVLPPTKIVGQMNIKRFAETYGKRGLNAQIFTDLDTAMAWLVAL